MDTLTITILVAIIGGFIGIANYVRTTRIDAGELGAALKKLETEVQHLEQQISELKEDIKNTQDTVEEIIENATKAKMTVNALNDRLDSLHIKPAARFKQ